MESEEEVAAKASTSTLLHHTIPPFYACYLLRSLKAKRAAIYIGSTPDPPRRIKQHNGLITGGAFKTKRGRPWEMELIVYGFPSKLQALQFEWAWQNPHMSRHLHSLATPSSTDKPTAQFPKTPLSNRPTTKVQVLQFMLTRPPWKDFKLRIMLFSELSHGWWTEARLLGAIVRTDVAKRKYLKERTAQGNKAVDAWGASGRLLDAVDVRSRYEGVDGSRMERSGNAEMEPGVKLVVNDDDFFLPYWTKWTTLLAFESSPRCHFCSSAVDLTNHLTFVLCVTSTCQQLSHLPCLAAHFLSTPSATTPDSITPLLPSEGQCPTCRETIHWQYLIRGSYRRWEESGGGERKKKSRIVVKKIPKVKAASKRKGKGKEVVEESSEEEFEEEEEEEAERSWAHIEAAEGAIDVAEEEGTDSDTDDDELRYKPSQPAPPTQPIVRKLAFAVSKPSVVKSTSKPKAAPDPIVNRRILPAALDEGDEEELPTVDQLLRDFKATTGTSKRRAEKVYLEISD